MGNNSIEFVSDDEFVSGDVRAYFLVHDGCWLCDEWPENVISEYLEDKDIGRLDDKDKPNVELWAEQMRVMRPDEVLRLGKEVRHADE